VRLLRQPDDGVAQLVRGIDSAKSSIEIVIFRFDQPEVERALASAVSRGVTVRALIAHVNGSGGDGLRRLEMRLLPAGVTVARTGNGLARYHAKFMILDHHELYLLAFNFTNQDINHTRSFGLVVQDRRLVQEALKLFEADTTRQPYEPGLPTFVVSPANARQELCAFIEGAKSELLIYDPKVSDSAMIHLLEERAEKKVNIQLIGQSSSVGERFAIRKLSQCRLHARAMVRDRQIAFVGSQSLRKIELDGRREVGIVFSDPSAVNELATTFQEDWEAAEQIQVLAPAAKVAKKVAKAISKELPPVAPLLDVTLKEMRGDRFDLAVDADEIEDAVRDAVKDAVQVAVEDAIDGAGKNLNAKR
jgi:cardiolipin synthase